MSNLFVLSSKIDVRFVEGVCDEAHLDEGHPGQGLFQFLAKVENCTKAHGTEIIAESNIAEHAIDFEILESGVPKNTVRNYQIYSAEDSIMRRLCGIGRK